MSTNEYFTCKTLSATISLEACKRNKKSEFEPIRAKCEICKRENEFKQIRFSLEEVLTNQHVAILGNQNI